jgi:hypothetical protein
MRDTTPAGTTERRSTPRCTAGRWCLGIAVLACAAGAGAGPSPAGPVFEADDGSSPAHSVRRSRFAAQGGIAAGDRFGFSVAYSGYTALVGVPNRDNGAVADSGQVKVFVRTGTSWRLQATLIGLDSAAGDEFGYAVAISGDTAVVGARNHGPAEPGAAYVFVRNGGTWSQQAKLTGIGVLQFSEFGSAVAIENDTVLVGTRGGGNTLSVRPGAVYVFTRSAATWLQQVQIVPADALHADQFGAALTLSGTTAVIGAPRADTSGGADAGAAYVYTGSGSAWNLQQKISAADGASSDQFGSAVALSGDTVLIGAPLDDTLSQVNAGAAYIFVRSGVSWSPQAKLLTQATSESLTLGSSVALAGDLAVLGAAVGVQQPGNVGTGTAHVFTRSGTAWAERTRLAASDSNAGDRFAQVMALDGDRVLLGAPEADLAGGVANAGAAYVFRGSAAAWVLETRLDGADLFRDGFE